MSGRLPPSDRGRMLLGRDASICHRSLVAKGSNIKGMVFSRLFHVLRHNRISWIEHSAGWSIGRRLRDVAIFSPTPHADGQVESAGDSSIAAHRYEGAGVEPARSYRFGWRIDRCLSRSID